VLFVIALARAVIRCAVITRRTVVSCATDSTHTSPTNYFALASHEHTRNARYISDSDPPAAYFGFWWSAGDQFNKIDLYQGSTLFATFSTQDCLPSSITESARSRH